MLSRVWQRHLERQGAVVTCVPDAEAAVTQIGTAVFDVVVLDLMLSHGGALAVADMVAFRQPEANVIFVTDTSFFSDGSIFRHSAAVRLMLRRETPPEELATIVAHYGSRSAAAMR